MLALPLALLEPLLTAAAEPSARVIVGGVKVGDWYSINPAVLDAESAPLWVGAYQIVAFAARKGLLQLASRGKRLTTWEITPEGRAIQRGLHRSATRWREEAERLERELAALQATIDSKIEAAEPKPRLARDAVLCVLGQAEGPLSMAEVSERVVAMGFKTNRHSVAAMIQYLRRYMKAPIRSERGTGYWLEAQ